jgi:hypothetical protein
MVEQVVAPSHHCLEGLLARQRVAGPGCQSAKRSTRCPAMLSMLSPLTSGAALYRQRNPIELAADVADDLQIVPSVAALRQYRLPASHEHTAPLGCPRCARESPRGRVEAAPANATHQPI